MQRYLSDGRASPDRCPRSLLGRGNFVVWPHSFRLLEMRVEDEVGS